MGNELIVGTGALAPNRSLNVLVAEDSRADAELLLAALKHAGVALGNFDVVDAPESFRRRLDDTRYDIVLTDHSLITWTGMDALAILRDTGTNIPLIVVTGSLGDEQAVQYIKKGAADYVLKENLGHLVTAIDHALRENAIRDHAAQLQVQIARGKREWELTFDSVPDPTFVIGEDCRIVRANRAAANVFGMSFDAIIGKYCYEVIHDRPTPLPTCPHQGLLQSGEAAEGDIEELRLGKTFHSTTSVLRDPDGVFRGCVHVLHDVTQRRAIEKALRNSEEKFAAIFRSSPDAIALATVQDGRILEVNDHFTRLTQYEREELIGRTGLELGFWPDRTFRNDVIETMRRTGFVRDVEVPAQIKSGEIRLLAYSGEEVDLSGEPCMISIVRDITDRKRIFENIRRQSLVFENMNDAVIVVDASFKIVDWNQAASRIFGYEKHEVLGKNPSIINRPEFADAEFAIISAQVAETGRWQGEMQFVGKDGREGVCEMVIVPLHDAKGLAVAQIGVCRDITERKLVERALLESEKKYRMLFEDNPQPMWVYECTSLRFLAVNQAAVDHYGYSRDEFLSMTLKDIRPPEDVPALLRTARRVTGAVDKAGVWRHKAKDGRTFYVEITDCRIVFEGRRASLVLANDVTEQKRAERELQQSEQKYRELIENAIYGIFRGTVDGTLLDVNPAFVEMLGYTSKEELLQVNLTTGVYEDPAERARVLRGYRNAPGRVRAETNFKRKDGALIKVRLDGREVRSADNRTLFFEVFVEDVTEQKNLEEQFRQAQKMEAVGRLAGGIAHDFNNVLMVINSYAEMITNRDLQDPTIGRYAERIVNGAQKAAALTSKLLAFSRKQVLQPAVLDVQALVGEFQNMISPMLGEDIEVTIAAAPGLGNVYADRTQIDQVLMNLTVNARDAMPNGGKLLIELNNIDVDEKYTQRHPQVPPGDYVVLKVTDNGTGMDAATQARIFEPFFTTKGVGKGTGLGLSTVYGIVKQSGGYIWVESEPDVGTTFKIYFPRVSKKAVSASDQPEETEINAGNNETILLVDDEADLRSATREFLEEKGYRVLEAENGAGALGICTAHRGSIEALVTDLIMPGMKGPVLAAKIASLYPRIKTVFMSGYTDHSQDIEELGRDAVFLSKPFSLNTLAQKLQSVLHQKTRAGSD